MTDSAPPPEMPPIDFTTFVLSLSAAGMEQLGHAARLGKEDASGLAALLMARQNVEILELLEEKTHGNLSGEEERMLAQVVNDLREAYERHA